ncbi:hypothetical protein GL325_10520 [Aeromicrobium sp. 636]|nr:hypothetical protein [Aeromicrobium sp. 636]
MSLTGTAQIVEDRERIKDLWDSSSGAFMSGGPEDPDNIALRIDGVTAEYGESPGKVTAAIQLVKGLVTDKQPDQGDSGTVHL